MMPNFSAPRNKNWGIEFLLLMAQMTHWLGIILKETKFFTAVGWEGSMSIYAKNRQGCSKAALSGDGVVSS
jgi:hypothetical protein